MKVKYFIDFAQMPCFKVPIAGDLSQDASGTELRKLLHGLVDFAVSV